MKVMRTTVATVVAATLSMSAFSVFAEASLTGAGATFPAPVYAKWADTYQKETGNKVNYQGIGSSGGVKQIIANTVDFGASDAPLSDEKLAQEGLFQFPTVIGGVVLAVNIPGLKSGELKHGPLALIDADMPVIVVAPNNELLEKLKSNIEEVRARGGQLYVFADQDAGFVSSDNMHIIEMPHVEEVIAPIFYTVPLQLLAYHVALIKGTDVDQPRNLAKSVTVE